MFKVALRFFASSRLKPEALVGAVLRRRAGLRRAAAMSSSSLPAAAARFCSCVRYSEAVINIEPSADSLEPAALRSRAAASAGRPERSGKKRSCTAVEVLLTFWPPWPPLLMNFSSREPGGVYFPC
jgi:hypothetical protein